MKDTLEVLLWALETAATDPGQSELEFTQEEVQYLARAVRLAKAWDAARGKPLMEMFKDMEAAEGDK